MSIEDNIHIFRHHAMATEWQLRIADQERPYAASVAQTCFAEISRLEQLMSRFRSDSEISHITQLTPGENLRLTYDVFTCLTEAREYETLTRGAFSVTARQGTGLTSWDLDPANFTLTCKQAPLIMDLGAIGKGFALDHCVTTLAEWGVSSFLWVAGGSSVLAGEAPQGMKGWNVGLGDEVVKSRWWLRHASLSGSGTAAQGQHIVDPRTGKAASIRHRAWAFSAKASMGDALSTAAMLLTDPELTEIIATRTDARIITGDAGLEKHYGTYPLPEVV